MHLLAGPCIIISDNFGPLPLTPGVIPTSRLRLIVSTAARTRLQLLQSKFTAEGRSQRPHQPEHSLLGMSAQSTLRQRPPGLLTAFAHCLQSLFLEVTKIATNP